MEKEKKVLYILYAIIAFIITAVAYLLVKQHYILASSIILVCGLGVCASVQLVAVEVVQQNILKYLDQNNNEATVVEIINHLYRSSKKHDKTTITNIAHYSIKKLIQKNMIVNNQGRVRKVT